MALDKTFDPASAEARIYNTWEAAGCFKAGSHVASKNSTSTYAIMIPPPNVTGVLHMGHAFNNTLQDILVRWKRMQGFDTLWQAGTDHAGIATQMVVERRLAEAGEPGRRELGREKFLEKVWAWKEQSGGTIVSQLKRLGASCDWDRTAFTMAGAQGDTRTGHENSPNFHDAVIKVFVDMYNKGFIYRGKRLVNWDPHFETAISDLEVENIEVAGHMWHFKYPLAGGATYTYVEKDEDGNVVLEEERDYISIATTRPETMLGDGAVAVHPSDERYAPIVGKLCEIPVGPKEHRRLIPIITDEYPDPDFGSGAVKITGAHDFNDYQVAKRGGIPMYRLMDMKGAMRADGAAYADEAAKAQAHANGAHFTENEVDAINLVPEEYRGLDRFDARAKVVADITAEGLAVMTTDGEGNTIPYVENKPIMQPFGDRSKVVIEPMLTDQWFVDAEKIVGPAMDAVNDGKIKLLPEREKKVWDHWLENIEPWCISRQLWWGHQIPVWFDGDGNQYCAATQEEAQNMAGVGVDLTRDPDVLDTWFSSGLWPIGTLGWPDWDEDTKKYFPTNDLITGTDILFFWVARMVMMQLAVVDEIPFSNVYLHGLVRDAKGKKMSKSTGNVVDPLDIIDEYGADALRFSSAAMAALGGVLKLDMQRIAGYRNFGTKLWNAARFAEMNDAYGLDVSGEASAKLAVNRWIIGEVGRVRVAVDDALQGYRFNDAANALYSFVWGTVCDWYVELSKPLLQGDDADAKDETRKVLSWVIDQCLILLHPIMPFITEELWQGDGLLAVQPWPTYGLDLVDQDADAEVRWTITLIENIRSARAQLNVPAGAKVPLVQVANDAAGQAALDANLALVQRLARVDTVSTADAMPKGAISVTAPGASFGLPIADLIDVDKEHARLSKNLGKLEKEIGGLNGRLNNPKFVASAPDEVVAEAKANLAARSEEADKVKEALARLSEMG
ncbi:MAG: valine--tRNA ligase [Planktomarina sp.]